MGFTFSQGNVLDTEAQGLAGDLTPETQKHRVDDLLGAIRVRLSMTHLMHTFGQLATPRNLLGKKTTKQIKRRKPHRSKAYEMLKNMKKQNVFGVYIFMLYMMASSHWASFSLHLKNLNSALHGNAITSLSMPSFVQSRLSHSIPSSASKSQTHYQPGTGMNSLRSSQLPSSVLIVLSATNSVLKGKNIRGR